MIHLVPHANGSQDDDEVTHSIVKLKGEIGIKLV